MKMISIDSYYKPKIDYLMHNTRMFGEDVRLFITLIKNRFRIKDTKQFIGLIYDHMANGILLEEDMDIDILYFCSDFIRFLNKERVVNEYYYNYYKKLYANISQGTINKINDFITKYGKVWSIEGFAVSYFGLYKYVPFNKNIFNEKFYNCIYEDLNKFYNCGDKFKEELDRCYKEAKEWYDNNIETEVDKLINLLIKRHNLEEYFK